MIPQVSSVWSTNLASGSAVGSGNSVAEGVGAGVRFVSGEAVA